jgi:hypothetical protein
MKRDEKHTEETLELSKKLNEEKLANLEMMKLLLNTKESTHGETLKIIEEKIQISEQLAIELTKSEMLALRLDSEVKNHKDKLKRVEDTIQISNQLAVETTKSEMLALRLAAEAKNQQEQIIREQVKFDTFLQREDRHRKEVQENNEKLTQERENVRTNQLDYAKLNAEVLIAAFKSIAK